jgi:RNA polymerase sigma factor (sigma-70 family)
MEPSRRCRTLRCVDHEDDAHDWQRAVAGDGEAFGQIFDRHRARLYRHTHRLVPLAADMDDVVAVTFFEAWRRRDSVRFVDGSLLPWLLVTATNAARNVSRSARRYQALLERLPPTPVLHEQSDDDAATRALTRLSLADQQVITLCVLEGLSESEAADALGIPIGTVKSRLSRAKSRLAAKLKPHHPARGVSQKEATHEL